MLLLTIKKYWKLFVVVLGGIFGILLLKRRGNISFLDDFKKIQDAHNDAIKSIDDIRKTEQQNIEHNNDELSKKLDELADDHVVKQRELDERVNVVRDEIVKKTNENPVELAKELQSETGFKIIMPKDDK